MILKDIKRQVLSIGMVLSLVIGLIMLLIDYYPEIRGFFDLGIIYNYDYLYFFEHCLNSGLYLIFTPLVAVLPGVIQFCDDYNYGYSRLIITRVKKKEFLAKRYIATVICGGIACALPLIVIGICSIIFCDAPTELNLLEDSKIYESMEALWDGKVFMAHVCLYAFIFGVVWSSIGLMFVVLIPNRYVALGAPLAVFYIAHIICSVTDNFLYSPTNTLYINYQNSQLFVIIYQLILLTVSATVYILVGNRRLKNA